MAKKKFEVSPEDKDLFRDAVKGVKPIEQDKHLPPSLGTKLRMSRKTILQPLDNFRFTGEFILEKLSSDEWLASENFINLIQGEIPHRTQKKLKRGQIPIEVKLDLHGYTGDEAIRALTQCLSMSQANGERVLLIIHGKSQLAGQHGPILKNIVYQWLKNQSKVLAIQSAHAKHGGSGAVYVLLRRQKP